MNKEEVTKLFFEFLGSITLHSHPPTSQVNDHYVNSAMYPHDRPHFTVVPAIYTHLSVRRISLNEQPHDTNPLSLDHIFFVSVFRSMNTNSELFLRFYR